MHVMYVNLQFKLFKNYFMYLSTLPACQYTMSRFGAHEGRKRHWIPCVWSYEQL